MKILSVIIVSFKNLQVIIDCLESIKKYNDMGEQLEVIVVDNSPNEKYIYNYLLNNYPEVIVIKNENKGFGQANNVGVENSKGKYILFLNPDTILVEPIFKFAQKRFEEDEKLALFGVKLLNKDLSFALSFYFINRIGILYTMIIKLCNRMNIFLQNEMFISGADLFVRKDIFIDAGMFDENIFMYKEESDLIRRILLLNKKFKIRFFKNKKIIHIGGESSRGYVEKTKAELRSILYCCKKYKLNKKKVLKKYLNLSNKKIIIYKYLNRKRYEEEMECRRIYLSAINTEKYGG